MANPFFASSLTLCHHQPPTSSASTQFSVAVSLSLPLMVKASPHSVAHRTLHRFANKVVPNGQMKAYRFSLLRGCASAARELCSPLHIPACGLGQPAVYSLVLAFSPSLFLLFLFVFLSLLYSIIAESALDPHCTQSAITTLVQYTRSISLPLCFILPSRPHPPASPLLSFSTPYQRALELSRSRQGTSLPPTRFPNACRSPASHKTTQATNTHAHTNTSTRTRKSFAEPATPLPSTYAFVVPHCPYISDFVCHFHHNWLILLYRIVDRSL